MILERSQLKLPEIEIHSAFFEILNSFTQWNGMPFYRINFEENKIVTCKLAVLRLPKGHPSHIYFHHDKTNKELVFAIIFANSEQEAMKDANTLIEDYLSGEARCN